MTKMLRESIWAVQGAFSDVEIEFYSDNHARLTRFVAYRIKDSIKLEETRPWRQVLGTCSE